MVTMMRMPHRCHLNPLMQVLVCVPQVRRRGLRGYREEVWDV